MFSIRRYSIFSCVALALLTALGGCGGESVVPTKGIVLLDGAPLAGANVNFLPDGGGSAAQQPAQAMTNAQGEFEMDTHGKMGAFAGKYRILVLKFEDVGGSPTNVLPEMYEVVDNTPLIVTIPHEGDLRLELVGNKASKKQPQVDTAYPTKGPRQ